MHIGWKISRGTRGFSWAAAHRPSRRARVTSWHSPLTTLREHKAPPSHFSAGVRSRAQTAQAQVPALCDLAQGT